jgi:hypothetical protein
MMPVFTRPKAKLGMERAGELVTRGAVVLPAALGDLDCPHEAAEAPRGFPVESAGDAVQDAAAVGVAAAGGVEDGGGFRGRDVDAAASGVDFRALGATCDDQRLDMARQRRQRFPGAGLQQFGLVVVEMT